MSAGRAIRALMLTSVTSLAAFAALSVATTGCAADSTPNAATASSAKAPDNAATTRAAKGKAPAAVPASSAPTATLSSTSTVTPTATATAAPAATSSVAEPQASAQVSSPASTSSDDKPETLVNVITPRPAVHLSPEQVAELAGLVAELRTSQGTVVIGFLPDKAPGTVQNFVELARSGFYDGTQIHRVIPGMFIQGGDPTGTGDGGPGYFIRAEFNDEPHVRGTVSMSRLRHPDSAGSQFFICLAALPYLDGGYTGFGHVLSGDEVLDRIEKLGRATPQGTPTETITLDKVLIRPRSPSERPTASRP